MKISQFVSIVTIVVYSAGFGPAPAQLLAGKANTQTDRAAYTDKHATAVKDAKSVYKNEKASFRAQKNFANTFASGTDVKWFAEEKVLGAFFERDAIKTWVIYDKKGHWLHTMHVYQQNNMPAFVRSIIKQSQYSSYDITLVQEIKESNIIFFVVHLEDAQTIKRVTVYDGEVNLIHDLNKQL